MGKRKAYATLKSKKQKVVSLPDINDDSNIVPECSCDLLDEIVFSDSSYLGVGSSDEESDLPVGPVGTNTETEDNKLKPGDLAWIKHGRNTCFWPAYVKTIAKGKVSVYFIGYNKFQKGEKSFRYNVKSKSVEHFNTKLYDKFIEEGRSFNKGIDDKLASGTEENLTAFNNAVELANSYNFSKKELAGEREVLEFFHSDGLSLCVPSTNGSPDSTVNISEDTSERTITAVDLTNETQTDAQRTNEEDPISSINGHTVALIPESPSTPAVAGNKSSTDNHVFGYYSSKNRSKTKRLTESLNFFNEKNVDVVNYIVDGGCDKHIQGILDGSIPSKRMKAFFKKWDVISLIPKSKNMEIEGSYFEDEGQLRMVVDYLKFFLESKASHYKGQTKLHDLLFNVFLPEATIFSLHKVKRRRVTQAEKMFDDGCEHGLPTDPLLMTPLTDEERASVERRNKFFAEKIKSL